MLTVKNDLRERGIVLQGTGNSATRSYGTRERQRGVKEKKKSAQIIVDHKQEADL